MQSMVRFFGQPEHLSEMVLVIIYCITFVSSYLCKEIVLVTILCSAIADSIK